MILFDFSSGLFFLSAGTYNCTGCYFTWARACGLVIMLQLQQNSNELHPQESWMCWHWKRGSDSTDSSLPVTCRWPEKWNLSTHCRLLTHVQSGPKTKQRAQIAGEVTVAPGGLLRITQRKLNILGGKMPYFWFGSHGISIMSDKLQHGIQYYTHAVYAEYVYSPSALREPQCWGWPQSSWMI